MQFVDFICLLFLFRRNVLYLNKLKQKKMTNLEILQDLNSLSRSTLTELKPLKRAGKCMLLRASDTTFDVYLNMSNGALVAKMPNGRLFTAI